MYEPRFRGIDAKIVRAGEHRDLLDSYIANVFRVEANRPAIGVKFKPETGEHVVYVSHIPDSMADIVTRVGVLIGDFAHDLRSALDHLVYQLALKNHGGSLTSDQERRLQFPIEDDPAVFTGRCTLRSRGNGRGAYIADLHPDDQAIIKRFQVFNRINDDLPPNRPYLHPLRALRDLSDKDKHRLVTTVGAAPTAAHNVSMDANLIMKAHIERSLRSTSTVRTRHVELGAELFHAVMPNWAAETDVKVHGYIVPEIRLDNGWPVLEVMDRIGTMVVKVIGEFAPPFDDFSSAGSHGTPPA